MCYVDRKIAEQYRCDMYSTDVYRDCDDKRNFAVSATLTFRLFSVFKDVVVY